MRSLFGFFISLSLLTGCNFRHDKQTLDQGVISDRGLNAFRSSVYSFVRANCIDCHGREQNPRFAQDNVEVAYRLAKTKVNFGRMADSLLVSQTRNGHCGNRCQTDGRAMKAAIEYWWLHGEKSAGTPVPSPEARIETSPIAVPKNLPNGNEYVRFRYALPEGARFEIDVQRFGAQAYRVRWPRLVNGPKPIYIKDVRLLLNRHFDPSFSDFLSVSQEVAAFHAPVLSGNAQLMMAQGTDDEISLSIGQLSVVSATPCPHLPLFEMTVAPILERQCLTCHKRGTAGEYPLTLQGLAEEVCESVMERVNRNDLLMSPILSFPLVQAGGHPSRVLSPADAETILSFLRL